jgi:hypothetical protein
VILRRRGLRCISACSFQFPFGLSIPNLGSGKEEENPFGKEMCIILRILRMRECKLLTLNRPGLATNLH